ncbi:MAG TPA: hypothetical protein VHD55_00355 [Candidatus Paceibacterota bacterium]|nr:hypothetical protein [Candidatus Paceibacterota bacterium]
MAKALDAATPSDVLAALADWETRREQLRVTSQLPPRQVQKPEELVRLLETEKSVICASIVNSIAANSYGNRMRLADTSPAMHEFLKKVYRDRGILDALRDWFEATFEGRIRVEGDPDVTGYHLEFAEKIEVDEFERFPINHEGPSMN